MLIAFLVVITVIWLLFAAISDLKKREIPNWLNFSLIIFVLGARLIYSVFSENFSFFVQGLFGFAILFSLANLFYYGKFFAGGDAKLLIALGPIITLGENFADNLNLIFMFLLVFLFCGALYGIAASIYYGLKNKDKVKKIFSNEIKTNKKIFYVFGGIGTVFIFLGFVSTVFFILGFVTLIMPFMFIYAKIIDSHVMCKKILSSKLREGDWLFKDVKIGKKIIKQKWDGLSKTEIELLKKRYKFVLIKEGIPFAPVFLAAFLVFIYFYNYWAYFLWNSFR